MECNKDEAVRAKEIAERKVTEKDYIGAKKFALKAQNLYPHLDDLPQMLTTIDVYISAENKICGEADWYGILGVDPWVDDEIVRKQYRKLALMLHPDKNKCRGADGAFKLVSEAWGLLSDKAKRFEYNQKRTSRGIHKKLPNQSGIPPHQPTTNGFQYTRNNATSSVRARSKDARVDPASFPSSHQKSGTFWTICNSCKTQYEYLRVYLNQTLLCPNCHEAFLAVEKAPPPNIFKSSNFSSHQQPQNSRHQAANRNPHSTSVRDPSGHHHSSNNQNHRWDSFSRMANVNNRNASAQAASVVQQAHERVKRGLEEPHATAEWDASRKSFKKPRAEDFHADGPYAGSWENQTAMETETGFRSSSDSVRGNFQTSSTYGITGYYHLADRILTSLEVRKMLARKARKDISKKLEDWSSVPVAKEKTKEREKKSLRPESKVGSDCNELKMKSGPEVIEDIADDSDVENHEPVTINVPDSDFHSFDLDRAEISFADDQVWAAYDDEDGMPRFYARIQKVISLNPFKIRISWLNSRSNSELGPIDWVGSGFTKTCGDFRTGRQELSEGLNSFSHKVQFTKGTRGVIRIFPRKGDVWALYRNWSPDWNENTADEVIHKYDMVEVLDDYNEEQGVTVIALVKVAGFRAVFCKSTDPDDVRRIPKEEMFRFSHQVPNYVLTGQEADNAPEGFWELDPAATPFEYLQENTETKEAPKVENEKAESTEAEK